MEGHIVGEVTFEGDTRPIVVDELGQAWADPPFDLPRRDVITTWRFNQPGVFWLMPLGIEMTVTERDGEILTERTDSGRPL